MYRVVRERCERTINNPTNIFVFEVSNLPRNIRPISATKNGRNSNLFMIQISSDYTIYNFQKCYTGEVNI